MTVVAQEDKNKIDLLEALGLTKSIMAKLPWYMKSKIIKGKQYIVFNKWVVLWMIICNVIKGKYSEIFMQEIEEKYFK